MASPKKGVPPSVTISPKKSRTSSLSTSKKPTKKILKKPTEKLAPKKKSLRTTAPTDVLGKSITIAGSNDLGRKIKIVENISARRKKTASTYQKSGTPTLSEFKTKIHLALATPFRFNVDHGQLASNVARYAGTAFVVIGGFLTLYNMNALAIFLSTPPAQQQAQISTCVAGTDCTTDTGTSGSGTLNPTPTVDVTVESSASLLTSTVPIVVTAPYATRVDVIAIERSTNRTQSVGTAVRISDLAWRAYWQTTAFEDGEYRLRVIVTNQFGTYTEENSESYIIENHPVTDTTVATSPDTTTSTSTATTPDANVTTATTSVSESNTTLRVELGMVEPLHDRTTIRTYVSGAQTVRHYVRRDGTTTYTLVGNAVLHSTGEWRFEFHTTTFIDGVYDIRTQAILNDGTNRTEIIENVEIDNVTDEDVEPPATVLEQTNNEPITTGIDNIFPDIRIEFTRSNPLRDVVDAYVHVPGATFVELFAIPERALTARFLGLAIRQSDTAWRFRFDTRMIPNGSYEFYANVRHQYGDTESSRTPININNVVTVTPSTDSAVTTLIQTSDEVAVLTKRATSSGTTSTPQTTRDLLVEDLGDAYTDDIDIALAVFIDELGFTMREYGRALRTDDTKRAHELLITLEEMRARVIRELPRSDDTSEIIIRIEEYIENMMKDIQERTEKSEALIKERLGADVKKDSDSDGITDYDEVSIYMTDPLNADSDSDGVIDGIEVLNGYNPLDAKREANIVYESPVDKGVVREDILTISHVTTVRDGDSERPKAHIGGTALPNSFVTLYIFSTPIIVTVKADEYGNWSYLFDKELENGEHNVYVGMTDNAGRIVARSNPLPFVKTAEAFSLVSEEVAIMVTPEEPALISEKALLVTGSIAVVALGLVLLLLGLYVRPKEKVSLEFAQPAT